MRFAPCLKLKKTTKDTEELERTEVKCTQFDMYGKMWNTSTHATSLIRGVLCDKQPTNDQIVGIICLVLSSAQQI